MPYSANSVYNKDFIIFQLGLTPDEFPSVPSLLVCPSSASIKSILNDVSARESVEAALPPMKHLWPEWRRVVTGEYNHDEAEGEQQVPWENSTAAVRRLMQQVMVEGGLMSIYSCENAVTNCSFGDCCQGAKLELALTGEDKNGGGLCYRIKPPGSTEDTDSTTFLLGDYLKSARRDLNPRVLLTGTSSTRVGFPLVETDYFGQGYLCPDAFGDKEAAVICRSIGFTGGERLESRKLCRINFLLKNNMYVIRFRFRLDLPITFAPSNVLGVRINCGGDESDILDCAADYTGLDGRGLTQCGRQEKVGEDEEDAPMGVICDQVNIGRKVIPRDSLYPSVPTVSTVPTCIVMACCSFFHGICVTLPFCRLSFYF